MSVIYILVPLALGLAAISVAVFLLTLRGGQYDDLDTPAHRILFDDEPVDSASPSEETGNEPTDNKKLPRTDREKVD